MRLTLTHKGGERTVYAHLDDATTVAHLSEALGVNLAAACEVPERQSHVVAVTQTPLLNGSRLPPSGEATPAGSIRLEIIGGPFAGNAVPLTDGVRFSVGSGHGAWLRLPDALLAEVHAHLTVGSPALRSQPPGAPHRSSGQAPTPLVGQVTPAAGCVVRVNGEAVTEPTPIAPIDIVQIGASLFRLGIEPTSDADLRPGAGGMRAFNRPSRIRVDKLLPTVRLQGIQPDPPELPPLSWITAALPIVLGVVMALLLARPFMLLMAAASPVMVVGSFLVNRRLTNRRGASAREAWEREAAEAEALVAGVARSQRADAWYDWPDPLSIIDITTKPLARLWERRIHDSDALMVRVGTGTLPLKAQMQGGVHSKDASVIDVSPLPVTVNLASGPVGIAGDAAGGTADAAAVQAVARAMVATLAALRSPRDLKLVVLCGERDEQSWGWIAWLPHAIPDAGPAALIGNTDGTRRERLRELNALLQQRKQAGNGAAFAEHYLVIIDQARELRSLPGMVNLLRDGPAVGMHVIALDADTSRLPEECRSLIILHKAHASAGSSAARIETQDAFYPGVLLDSIPLAAANSIARSLCSIEHVTGAGDEGSLPSSARFAELTGINTDPAAATHTAAALLERWNLEPRRTFVTVGATAEGEFAIDLAADGPHAIVAGTTGSGKSEFLQTLVVSLALANRPDALNFVLVDYKGGSAFADCEGLPHTVGMVTNLDARETERALDSLDAELRRRETVLGEIGAKDLDAAWQRDPAEASRSGLARLVLVVDEFAELKAELPEFISGLVRIARVGRSLGVHLVLATQRPSGIVTPEIQSNVNLRVALRVTDRADSNDILGSTEAAHIPASLPGRGYVRSALGGPPTAFQTARVAGLRRNLHMPHRAPVSIEELTWEKLGHPLNLAPRVAQHDSSDHDDTDLRALVSLAIEASTIGGLKRRPSPWLQPLPNVIPLDTLLATPANTCELTLGLQDLPAQQAQRPLTWNPTEDGSLLFIGDARSGRTSAVRTILAQAIVRYSPADLHIYIADFGNGALLPLAGAPHCGAVVTQTDVGRLSRLTLRLTAELDRRQAVLSAAGIGNAKEQRASAPAEERLAYAIFVIDGWENLAATLGPDQIMDFRQQILRALREGPAVGMRIIVTAGPSFIGDKVASAIETKYLLPMRDPNSYRAAGVTPQGPGTTFIPGRIISGSERRETQLSVLSSDVSDEAQLRALRAHIALSRDLYAQQLQPAALRVDPLPTRISLRQAVTLPAHWATSPRGLVYGVGGDELRRVSATWEGVTGFVVAGPRGSGRSTLLATLLHQLNELGSICLVITPRPSPLTEVALARGITVLTGAATAASTGAEPTETLAERVDRLEASQRSEAKEHSSAYPVTLLIDDAEMLAHTPLEQQIAGLASRVSLALAIESDSASSSFGGALAQVKRHRQGVVLAPQHTLVGTALFGTPLPKPLVGNRSPGAGLAFINDGWVPIRTPTLARE